MSLEPKEFYLASNLKGNPFRSNPVFGADPRMNIWVGYEREQRLLLKFITRTRCDQVGNISFVMLYGGYGTGKSHALLWACNQIQNVKAAEFNSYCYFIPTLRKEKGKLTFAGAFHDDLIRKTGLKQHILQYKTWLSTTILRYRDQEQVNDTVTNEVIIESIIPSVDLSNFAKSIFKCEDEQDVELLISPRGITDYQAMLTFTLLVNLFVYPVELTAGTRRFRNAVYLFIDELDDLLRASVKEAREVNDILRHIYDSCPNCFGLVIALSAEVAVMSSIFEDYILTRIQRQIALGELDKAGAVEFILKVLDANRIEVGIKDGFYPFEKSAIEAIMNQLVNITPRKVVDTMQQILEEVRLAGFNPNTGSVDLAFLDDNDIIDEVLGNGGV